MKQQINSPFSCHHRKFATPHSPANPSRFENLTAKSGICCSLSFTRLSFRMRRRLNFFTHYMYGTLCFRNFLGAFFQNFGAAARAGIRNQGPAGSESRIRPAARPGIKNQGRCAARNRESRITAGGLAMVGLEFLFYFSGRVHCKLRIFGKCKAPGRVPTATRLPSPAPLGRGPGRRRAEAPHEGSGTRTALPYPPVRSARAPAQSDR